MKPREADKAPSLNELAAHLRNLTAESEAQKQRERRNTCIDFLNKWRSQMEEAAKNGKSYITISKNNVLPFGFLEFCQELGFSWDSYQDHYNIRWDNLSN
jgi:hypothetical protein